MPRKITILYRLCAIGQPGQHYLGVGIGIEADAAGIDFPASVISVRYRSIPEFRHQHFCSFRYRNDRMQIVQHSDINKIVGKMLVRHRQFYWYRLSRLVLHCSAMSPALLSNESLLIIVFFPIFCVVNCDSKVKETLVRNVLKKKRILNV